MNDALDDAKHTLLWEGHLVPVTKMFDMIGEPTRNPMHAFSCIAFIGDKGEKPYIPVSVHPGEIVARLDYSHAAIANSSRF